MRKALVLILLLVLATLAVRPQTVHTASTDLANLWLQLQTFASGIAIGGVTITPAASVTTYQITLPPNVGQAAYLLCNSGTPGVWTFCPQPSASVSLSPTSLNFGTVTLGSTSSPQSITITNTGAATLNISSISIAGTNPTQFAQTNGCSSTLAPTASCSASVTFHPTQFVGSYSALFSIADNAAGSPQQAPLSGVAGSSGHSVTLSWQLGVVDSGHGAATGAIIYRGTVSGTTGFLAMSALSSLPACPAGTPLGTYCYNDATVAFHTTYYYQVASSNSFGASGKSAQVTAVIP